MKQSEYENTVAAYNGEDWSGRTVGPFLVKGYSYTHRYPSGRSHKIWSVTCTMCDRDFELAAQKVVNGGAQKGCSECKGLWVRGANSPLWKGGRVVPKTFATKAKTKLARATKTLDWTLTLEDLDEMWDAQGGKCFYTGWPLEFGDSGTVQTASLDRTDSRSGYIVGNVRFVHKNINIMKWSMSEQDFLDTCKAVAIYEK